MDGVRFDDSKVIDDLDTQITGAEVATSSIPPLPGIPYGRYLDQEFHDQELEHVFRKSWLFAGHDSEFPRTGSYKQLDIPFAPVLVIRGRDGELRAFLNSCQHRGATVLREKAGHTPAMSCQYHGWTYDLTGKLIGVTSSSCFPEFKKADHSLPQLRCEKWGGFVFVNFDPDAEPLLDTLPKTVRDRFDAVLELNAERKMRRIYHRVWDLDCNWKAIVENFWESYHFDFLHGSTVATLLNASGSRLNLFKNGHGEIVTPYHPPSDRVWKGVMNAADSGLVLLPGMTQELADHLSHTNYFVLTFPNLAMNISATGINVVHQWPTSVGTSQLIVELYSEDWGDGPMPPDREAVAGIQAMVAEEDMSCMNSIQHSLQARPDGKVFLGVQEATIYNHHSEIDRMIGVENVRPDLRVQDVLGGAIIA